MTTSAVFSVAPTSSTARNTNCSSLAMSIAGACPVAVICCSFIPGRCLSAALAVGLGQVEVGGEHLAAVEGQEQRVAAAARGGPVVDVLVGGGVIAQAGRAGRRGLQGVGGVGGKRRARGGLVGDR